MRKRLSITAAAVLGSLLTIGAAERAAADDQLVERGKYLATVGDCVACHSVPGGKPFSGGLGMNTPVGVIYTPNITPDKATGIGAWSDDDFYHAFHDGIGHGGEYLYPAFPFPWFTKVTKDDALAIKAYLFSLPAVEAKTKPLGMMFPFNIRTALLAWRTAFFKPATFTPDPAKSDDVNRGAYLVEGLGHCGECHNRHNVFGASVWSGQLKGGEIDGWYAPNITSDGRQGVGNWSTEEIVTFLRKGAAPGGGVVVGPMKQTIEESLSHLTDADLHAMAAYLKSFTSKTSYTPTKGDQLASATSDGAGLFLTNCASCHGIDGKGVAGRIPALAGNGAVTAAGPENVIRVVVAGLPASDGLAPMPAAGAKLSDEDVATIVDYVRTAFGNTAPANAEAGMVAKLRAETTTLMSSSEDKGCSKPQAETTIATAVDQAGLKDALTGVKQPDMLQRIDDLLPKVKAKAPNASDDAIVNAMIEAYCPIVMADKDVPTGERTQAIGSFGGLVYGQIKKVDSGEPVKN